MNMSFQERSAWISLTVLLFVLYNYVAKVWVIISDDITQQHADKIIAIAFTQTILTIIVLEILVQTLLGLSNKRKVEIEGDERDQLIYLKAANGGYWVLSIGVILGIGHFMLNMQVKK